MLASLTFDAEKVEGLLVWVQDNKREGSVLFLVSGCFPPPCCCAVHSWYCFFGVRGKDTCLCQRLIACPAAPLCHLLRPRLSLWISLARLPICVPSCSVVLRVGALGLLVLLLLLLSTCLTVCLSDVSVLPRSWCIP